MPIAGVFVVGGCAIHGGLEVGADILPVVAVVRSNDHGGERILTVGAVDDIQQGRVGVVIHAAALHAVYEQREAILSGEIVSRCAAVLRDGALGNGGDESQQQHRTDKGRDTEGQYSFEKRYGLLHGFLSFPFPWPLLATAINPAGFIIFSGAIIAKFSFDCNKNT